VAKPAAILDLDGTLVDTNYQHALCWFRAFRRYDLTLPIWRLHRHVGMGGDKFVAAVAGDEVEESRGDDLRDAWEEEFDRLIDEVQPLEGAHDVLVELKERGHEIVLASSSIQKHFDHFIELIGGRDLADGWTTKDDVEASKPEPDLVRAALDKTSAERAIMLGDTPWDVEAAQRAGIETVCVMTGGFSQQELRDAGAVDVHSSLPTFAATLSDARWR
jgi:HAD superfamily hydrolase (TIGR01509 family)